MFCLTDPVGGCREKGSEDSAREAGVQRWEFFIGDRPHTAAIDAEGRRQPMAQIAAADRLVQSEEVLLSAEVVALVGASCKLQPTLDGHALLLGMAETDGAPADSASIARPKAGKELTVLPVGLQQLAVQVLRMHMLDNLRQRIEAGHKDFLNELRACTVVFVGLPSLSVEKPDSAGGLASVQAAIGVVQRRLQAAGGSLLQARCDEKGFLAVCAFGLPGSLHEDGAERAISAALAIVQRLQDAGERGCVGVTTGQLLCACIGSRVRAEYTVFGDAINLAARLMVTASAASADASDTSTPYDVLCDFRTRELTRGIANFTPLEPMHVKGKHHPVQVFAVTPAGGDSDPAGQSRCQAASSINRCESNEQLLIAEAGSVEYDGSVAGRLEPPVPLSPIVGRKRELDAIDTRIKAMARSSCLGHSTRTAGPADDNSPIVGGVIVLEGEAGIGKSRIVEEVLRIGLPESGNRLHLVVAKGDASTKSQVMVPWRAVMEQLLKHEQSVALLDNGSAWGACCRDRIPDYEARLSLVAASLEVPLSSLPLPPPKHVPHMAGLDSTKKIMAGLSRSLTMTTKQLASRAALTTGASANNRSLAASSSPATRRRTLLRSSSYEALSPALVAVPSSPFAAASTSWAGKWSGDGSTSADLSNAGGSGGTDGQMPQSAQSWGSRTPIPWAQEGLARASSAVPPGTSSRGARGRHSVGPSISNEIIKVQPLTNARRVAMTQALRGQRTNDLLADMLQEFITLYGRLVLMLEDVQHFDSASCRLLASLVEADPGNVLVIATCRPPDMAHHGNADRAGDLESPLPKALQPMANYKSTLRMHLQPFTADEASELVGNVFAGAAAPLELLTQASAAIWERSCGLPLFVEQMAVHLRQAVTGTHGARVRGNLEQLLQQSAAVVRGSASLPALITARIDRLRPSQQLTLKVAAVVGSSVPVALLAAVHPLMDGAPEELTDDLQRLATAHFLRPSAASGSVWLWTQALAREVAYELIPFSQRRLLHATLAEALEATLRRHKSAADRAEAIIRLDSAPRNANNPAVQDGDTMVDPNEDAVVEARRTAMAGAPSAATIAFHWHQSCVTEEAAQWQRALKAIEWWDTAGRQAMTAGASLEALRLLQHAAALADIIEDMSSGETKVWTWLMARRLAEEGTSPTSTAAIPADGDSSPSKPTAGDARRSVAGSLAGGLSRAQSGQLLTQTSDVKTPQPGTVGREQRVQWERLMADLALQLSDHETATCHALRALHLMGAPLPGQRRRRGRKLPAWLSCGQWIACTRPLDLDSNSSNSLNSSESDSRRTGRHKAALDQATRQAQEEVPPLSDTEADNAAAVLGMLLDTSAAANDPAAIMYVHNTAALLAGERGSAHSTSTAAGRALLLAVQRRSRALLSANGGRLGRSFDALRRHRRKPDPMLPSQSSLGPLPSSIATAAGSVLQTQRVPAEDQDCLPVSTRAPSI